MRKVHKEEGERGVRVGGGGVCLCSPGRFLSVGVSQFRGAPRECIETDGGFNRSAAFQN